MTAKRRELSRDMRDFLDNAPKELHSLKEELSECRAEIEKVVNENKWLFNELKHQVQVRLNSIVDYKNSGNAEVVTTLQEERDAALEARDKAVRLFENSVEEMSRMDAELKAKAEFVSPEDFEAAVLKLREEHVVKVDSLERQLHLTQKELRSASSSVHQLTWRLLKDGGTTVDNNQMKIGDILRAMENLQRQYNDLELSYQNLQSKCELQEDHLEKKKTRCKELETKVEHSRDRNEQLEAQLSQALQHAENSIHTAELAVSERNTMLHHVQDLQKSAAQLQAKLFESKKERERLIASKVEKIKLQLEAQLADVRCQLTASQEKIETLKDEANRVSRDRDDLSERLRKALETERLDRDQRLKEDKIFRDSTMQEVMDRRREFLDEKARREVLEQRYNEKCDENKRLSRKLGDAETALIDLKNETARIHRSMTDLKKESDRLSEERLKVEEELRKKQEEENDQLKTEIHRLMKKIELLEKIHNQVKEEFKKKIVKVYKREQKYKETAEFLEDRMKKQAGVLTG
ncbi:trichohyalin-like [Galendromus occidentalis]|uniref:Trichohyalin-like n=1 Tax=Galendromus occidentalis TaxID=34638 RepID=A0AAJ7L8V0_9ACAR|nr:trichohyalin-like [Galendromus occidentalis]